MNTFYVMDACALIAFLRDEAGAEAVTAVLKCAKQGKAEICMNPGFPRYTTMFY